MPPRRRSSSAPPSAASPSSQAVPESTSTSLLHALQAWEVVLAIGGRVYTIEEAPASLWVAILLGEDPLLGLLDLLDPEDQEDINDSILDGTITLAELSTALTELITLVSGRPWWLTLRLIHAAQGVWDAIGGFMALKGVRADQLSLQAWMDALLATLLRHIDSANHTSWLARMKAPPKGVEVKLDEQREEDVFRRQMGGQ